MICGDLWEQEILQAQEHILIYSSSNKNELLLFFIFVKITSKKKAYLLYPCYFLVLSAVLSYTQWEFREET
jgi:hypothetical protein